jgi:hypothetical protein
MRVSCGVRVSRVRVHKNLILNPNLCTTGFCSLFKAGGVRHWHSDLRFSISDSVFGAMTLLPCMVLLQVGGEKKPLAGGVSGFLAGFQKLMEAGQKDPFYAVVAYRNFRPVQG